MRVREHCSAVRAVPAHVVDRDDSVRGDLLVTALLAINPVELVVHLLYGLGVRLVVEVPADALAHVEETIPVINHDAIAVDVRRKVGGVEEAVVVEPVVSGGELEFRRYIQVRETGEILEFLIEYGAAVVVPALPTHVADYVIVFVFSFI